jgi:HK97 family phage portal protein
MEKKEKNSKITQKTASLRGFEYEHVPHAAGSGIDKNILSSTVDADIETLYNTVKASPEVVGCITAVMEDIMADGWRYEGAKFQITKVEDFIAQSKFYQLLTNAILDLLITGNAYILKLSVDEDKIASIAEKITNNVAKSLKVNVDKATIYQLINQGEVTTPKDLQLLKASTVTINFDETGVIKSYEQKVNGDSRIYRPKDIIHLTVMNIGGQPYGFTPLEPLLSDIATLIYAKEFAGKYFENDGIPYFLFNMPEETPDGRGYELLKKELKELKKQENKYKSLVTTGKIDVQQIQKFNKDMEYPKLIEHFTQVILMALGVPAHRINLTIDVRQVGGAVNRAYEGYYKKIAFTQQVLENILNSELFRHWRVKIVFNRAYKIDEMREAQVVQILTQAGLVTVEEAREMMGLEPQMPKGTPAVRTGDDMKINFNDVKRQDTGQDVNTNDNNKIDNKLK